MMFQALVSLLLLHCSYSEIIDCNGSHQCYNDTITCSQTNEDCTIHCNGDLSCSFSTIICPQFSSAKCSLHCNDNLSCDHTKIRAQSSLSLSIISNGNNALSSSKIYCNTCNITNIDSENGLNDINIYNINDFNAVNIIGCKSINKCWSNNGNPLLHYGDSYSKTCTISDTNICKPTDILIANNNELTPTTTFTHSISTTTILKNDDTDNILIKHKSETGKNNLHNALIYISIGIVCGIIVSICCCLIIFCFHIPHNKSSKLRIQTHNNINYNTKKLSPSLRGLSPQLTPTIVELTSNIDFMSKNSKMLTLSDKTQTCDGIIVTVERYANSTNQCDEEQIYSQSPIQSMVNMSNLGIDLVKSVSNTMHEEFVICGDDEHDINTPY